MNRGQRYNKDNLLEYIARRWTLLLAHYFNMVQPGKIGQMVYNVQNRPDGPKITVAAV